jgi:trehalose 2-sulfotransferase
MHVINRLYMAEFDFRTKVEQRLSYMIATVPRSGSTYFAIQMWRTGVLGAPMEYLNFPAMAKQLMPRFGIPSERA